MPRLLHRPSPARSPRALAAAALLVAAPFARAQAPTAPPSGPDPVLEELVEQSVAARPELRQAEATVRAQRERVPQAGALPDPVLSLGIQNDGFSDLQIGKMETSYYQVMVSQGIPWPGKRGLRSDVARLSADEAGVALSRVRLSTEADVRRAYLDLVLSRDRLALLARLENLWQASASLARTRYESGEGPQSDVLRAQLELNRLKQRRFALRAQETGALQALNRLRARPLDEPIATTATVRARGWAEPPPVDAELADALARSPELAQARVATARAGKQASLSRRERYPDLGVSLGVMPRGQLEPMWLAAVSVGLPIWGSRKQGRAVAESEARVEAGARGEEAVEQLLRLRVAERRTASAALLDTIRLYAEGLLVQSRATAESTLSQYRVGRVTFASVLEANAGYINDEEAFLAAVADAQRLAIAAAEVSLDPVGAGAGGGMATPRMPGVGAAGGGLRGGGGGAAAQGGGSEAAAGAMGSGM
jgi:outer membrane protein, heavy metal efflux system